MVGHGGGWRWRIGGMVHSEAGNGLLQKTGTGGGRYWAEIFLWLKEKGSRRFFWRALERKTRGVPGRRGFNRENEEQRRVLLEANPLFAWKEHSRYDSCELLISHFPSWLTFIFGISPGYLVYWLVWMLEVTRFALWDWLCILCFFFWCTLGVFDFSWKCLMLYSFPWFFCLKTMLLLPPYSTRSQLLDSSWHGTESLLCFSFHIFTVLFVHCSVSRWGWNDVFNNQDACTPQVWSWREVNSVKNFCDRDSASIYWFKMTATVLYWSFGPRLAHDI